MTIGCGEKIPKSATIKCTKCGTTLKMDKGDKVPPCPKCNNTKFTY